MKRTRLFSHFRDRRAWTALILLLVILPVLPTCSERGEFEFDEVILLPSTEGCLEEPEIVTAGVEEFAVQVITGYRQRLHERVDPTFHHEFYLAGDSGVRVRAFLSPIKESFVSFFPHENNLLCIDCFLLPVQMALLSGFQNKGLREEGLDVTLTVPMDEAIQSYLDPAAPAMFVVGDNVISMMVTNMELVSSFPKMFEFNGRHSIITLSGGSFCLSRRETICVHFGKFGLMTGEKELVWALEQASRIGSAFVEYEIIELSLESEFFRKALAHDELADHAKKILDRMGLLDRYPLWEFERDYAELQKLAKSYGIEDTSYANRLLKDESESVPRGILLWRYTGESSYMLQWTVLNIGCLLFFILVVFAFRPVRSSLRTITRLATPGLLMTLNAWAFFEKPESMHIGYWVIPGLPFMVCWLILAWTDLRCQHLDLPGTK